MRQRTPLGPDSSLCQGSSGGPRGVGVFLWARYPCTGAHRARRQCSAPPPPSRARAPRRERARMARANRLRDLTWGATYKTGAGEARSGTTHPLSQSAPLSPFLSLARPLSAQPGPSQRLQSPPTSPNGTTAGRSAPAPLSLSSLSPALSRSRPMAPTSRLAWGTPAWHKRKAFLLSSPEP